MANVEWSNVMQTNIAYTNGVSSPTDQLMRELYAGDVYAYYPLGNYSFSEKDYPPLQANP